MNSSTSLTCDISGHNKSNLAWGFIYDNRAVILWSNGVFLNSSFASFYDVTINNSISTLKILNSFISASYLCIDLSYSPIPLDINIFAACVTVGNAATSTFISTVNTGGSAGNSIASSSTGTAGSQSSFGIKNNELNLFLLIFTTFNSFLSLNA